MSKLKMALVLLVVASLLLVALVMSGQSVTKEQQLMAAPLTKDARVNKTQIL